MEKKTVIGVVAKNSLAYVKIVFDAYQDEIPVVLLRSLDDQARIEFTEVTETIEPIDEFGWFADDYQFGDADSLAQVSFTSGTEGEPKGVFLTHSALSDVTQRLNTIMDVDSSIREYVGVPPHFSFGLGRFRAVSAVGGRAFLPEFGFNPVEIRDMLKAGEINAISAVPTLWRILLQNQSIFGPETLNLKWIEIGSQFMSGLEKSQVKALFPNAVIVQHYGLTEASRSSFLRVDKATNAQLESVGQAIGSTQIKIAESGHICIKGPHVAKQLLVEGAHKDNVDRAGWLQTNDLGYIEDGFLFFQGRADDLINCAGVKLSPDGLEHDLRERLLIKDGIAIASYDHELTGNGVLLAFQKSLDFDKQVLFSALADILYTYGIHNKHVIKLISVDDFPKTTTGKVKRKALAELYKHHRMGDDVESLIEGTGGVIGDESYMNEKPTVNEALVQSIWQKVLSIKHVDLDANFYQLGGDSLTAISAVVAIEKLDDVPDEVSKGMLQGLTVREIAKQLNKQSGRVDYKHQINTPEVKAGMTINIVRGFLVLFVIGGHYSGGIFARLPASLDILAVYFAPAFAMGTPGFSIIYGVGAGFSLFPIFKSDPDRLKSILRKTVMLLLLGIIIWAMVKILKMSFSDESMTFTGVMNSFYSVLTYYLLISLSLFFWFRVISYSSMPAIFSIFLAVVFYTVHTFMIRDIGLYYAEGVVEFIKLLFTAKYSYFLMLNGTMLGISIGIFTRQLVVEDRVSLGSYAMVGLSLIILGIVFSVHAGHAAQWLVWPGEYNYIWRWVLYAGGVLVMLSMVDYLLGGYGASSRVVKFCFQFFSVIGMLAFPLYITHALVGPLKVVFSFFGVPGALALGSSMVIFLVGIFFLFRKVYRLSFL